MSKDKVLRLCNAYERLMIAMLQDWRPSQERKACYNKMMMLSQVIGEARLGEV